MEHDQKAVKKIGLKESNDPEQDLAYWLGKSPEDRVSAVEDLRRQVYGNIARLENCSHYPPSNVLVIFGQFELTKTNTRTVPSNSDIAPYLTEVI